MYQRGAALVDPYVRLHDRKYNASTTQADDELRRGINYLNRALEINPGNWSALWLKGKAEQALNERQAAYESFRAAYLLNPSNADLARELAVECMEIGRNAEAVDFAEAAWHNKGDDAGLLANLALAQLLNNDLEGSLGTINRAVKLDANDPITAAVKTTIEQVRSGHRSRPSRLSDLQ